MASQRTEKFTGLIKELSAEFLIKRSGVSSIITVTDCDVSPNFKKAIIFMTVLPESKEKAALDFARRQLGDLRNFIKEKISSKQIPFFEIQIDRGEKNRQKIDQLLREK